MATERSPDDSDSPANQMALLVVVEKLCYVYCGRTRHSVETSASPAFIL